MIKLSAGQQCPPGTKNIYTFFFSPCTGIVELACNPHGNNRREKDSVYPELR